jgi:hypothetical protein
MQFGCATDRTDKHFSGSLIGLHVHQRLLMRFHDFDPIRQ